MKKNKRKIIISLLSIFTLILTPVMVFMTINSNNSSGIEGILDPELSPENPINEVPIFSIENFDVVWTSYGTDSFYISFDFLMGDNNSNSSINLFLELSYFDFYIEETIFMPLEDLGLFSSTTNISKTIKLPENDYFHSFLFEWNIKLLFLQQNNLILLEDLDIFPGYNVGWYSYGKFEDRTESSIVVVTSLYTKEEIYFHWHKIIIIDEDSEQGLSGLELFESEFVVYDQITTGISFSKLYFETPDLEKTYWIYNFNLAGKLDEATGEIDWILLDGHGVPFQ